MVARTSFSLTTKIAKISIKNIAQIPMKIISERSTIFFLISALTPLSSLYFINVPETVITAMTRNKAKAPHLA